MQSYKYCSIIIVPFVINYYFVFLVFPQCGLFHVLYSCNLFVTVSTRLKILVFPLMGSLVPFLQCGLCCALESVGTRFCLFLTKHEPSCCYHSCDQIRIASTSWDETTYSLPFYISLSWRTCKHSGAVHFGNCSACILLPCSQSFQMPHMFLDGHIYSLSWIYSIQPCRTYRLLFVLYFGQANPLSHFRHWYCSQIFLSLSRSPWYMICLDCFSLLWDLLCSS